LAVKYYKMACDDGMPEACVRLTGQGLGAEGAAAATDLVQTNERLCKSGNASACNALGVSLYKGELVAQDRAKSLQFFNRGCKLGNKTACDNAATTQAELTNGQRDADRRAAELVARSDSARRPGTELSDADLACLKEGKEVYYTYENGRCLSGVQFSNGSTSCDRYESLQIPHARYTLENICSRTISIEEFCGSSSFSWGTLLPGDIYTRKFLYPCRLAY
jgi:hypothetical protein